MINISTTFEVSISIGYEEMNDGAR